MTQTKAITRFIPVSKFKILCLIAGGLLFVLAGVWMYNEAPYQIRYNIYYMRFIAILCITFFGAAAVFGSIQLFDNNAGLTIDNKGITYKAPGFFSMFYSWADIAAFEIRQISRTTRLIKICFYNPEQFMAKYTGWKRKAMEMNYRISGSPVSITTSTLQCKFDELYQTLNDALNYYKTQSIKS